MVRVIGAGFSRTGTMSLKRALEELGFGPCYHMDEIFRRPEHVAVWEAAGGGDLPDWQDLLTGYGAVADSPACHFWADLAEAFPDARIVLTRRQSEEWYRSFESTVYRAMTEPERLPPAAGPPLRMARELVLEGVFGGRFQDQNHAVGVYEGHNRRVLDTAPPDRLLDFSVARGWGPLAEFLGVPVPTTEFPHTNSRAAFAARSGLGE